MASTSNKDIGILLLRLFVGIRLIYGVIDNITSWQHMLDFRDFLSSYHFPQPLVSAIVSVYAQLIAGIMVILGWKIRWAAALMIINFMIAIFFVHWNQSFEEMTSPLAILFIHIFFLLAGAGKYRIPKAAGNSSQIS